MQADLAKKIRNNPHFQELEAKRGAFGWTLCILMLVIYYGFIFVVAFIPSVMSINVGGVITLAFPIGLAVIVSAVVLTGLYVIKANGEYDALTRKIQESIR